MENFETKTYVNIKTKFSIQFVYLFIGRGGGINYKCKYVGSYSVRNRKSKILI